jgi:hypothetical protein
MLIASASASILASTISSSSPSLIGVASDELIPIAAEPLEMPRAPPLADLALAGGQAFVGELHEIEVLADDFRQAELGIRSRIRAKG